jgi:hypothetical protein
VLALAFRESLKRTHLVCDIGLHTDKRSKAPARVMNWSDMQSVQEERSIPSIVLERTFELPTFTDGFP